MQKIKQRPCLILQSRNKIYAFAFSITIFVTILHFSNMPSTLFLEKKTIRFKERTVLNDTFQEDESDGLMLKSCDFNDENVVEMHYDSFESSRNFSFRVSLHDPIVDQVVSKGIKEGLFGPKEKYPSIDEVHSICEHSTGSYSIECGSARVFVEVGSAIGMVSLYAASRGMRVYAFDPLIPNIERLNQSLCLNGKRHCLQQPSVGISKSTCHQPSKWGSFSPLRFSVFWNLVGSTADDIGRLVESEPGNLAATMRGGGSVAAYVKMVTIDQSVPDEAIEILLLTCQGFEYDVSNLLLLFTLDSTCVNFHNRRFSEQYNISSQDVFETSFGGDITLMTSKT